MFTPPSPILSLRISSPHTELIVSVLLQASARRYSKQVGLPTYPPNFSSRYVTLLPPSVFDIPSMFPIRPISSDLRPQCLFR